MLGACRADMRNRIEVVKGDLLQEFFTLDCIDDLSVVESVHFTSNAQMIDVTLAYSETENGFYLNLSSEQTDELTACTGTYDLTIVFKSGNRLTVIRNAPFVVWDKLNTIATEVDDDG